MEPLRSDFVDDLSRTVERLRRSEPEETSAPQQQARLAFLPDLERVLAEASGRARSRARDIVAAHLDRVPGSPLVGSVSVFRALGFRRDEVSHTQSLAWLLDPQQDHGFGDALLRRFVGAVTCDGDVDLERLRAFILAQATTRARATAEYSLSATCRADVIVEGHASGADGWSLVVEAKIDASERKNQLSELLATAPHPHRLGVFLSVDGGHGTTADHAWARLSYRTWSRHLIAAIPDLAGTRGLPFLRMYITGLLEDVCRMRCGGSVDEVLAWNNPFELEQLLGEQ